VKIEEEDKKKNNDIVEEHSNEGDSDVSDNGKPPDEKEEGRGNKIVINETPSRKPSKEESDVGNSSEKRGVESEEEDVDTSDEDEEKVEAEIKKAEETEAYE
jgi:hypothetical protein